MAMPMQVDPAQDVSRKAHRRGLRSAAAATVIVAAATIGVGTAPAAAASARFPIGGSAWTTIVMTASITSSTSGAALLSRMRSALVALPDSGSIHINQILKNLATGKLGS